MVAEGELRENYVETEAMTAIYSEQSGEPLEEFIQGNAGCFFFFCGDWTIREQERRKVDWLGVYQDLGERIVA